MKIKDIIPWVSIAISIMSAFISWAAYNTNIKTFYALNRPIIKITFPVDRPAIMPYIEEDKIKLNLQILFKNLGNLSAKKVKLVNSYVLLNYEKLEEKILLDKNNVIIFDEFPKEDNYRVYEVGFISTNAGLIKAIEEQTFSATVYVGLEYFNDVNSKKEETATKQLLKFNQKPSYIYESKPK